VRSPVTIEPADPPATNPRGRFDGGIGLVLGAGGVVGQAYHAGALLAIEHHLGWDPRSASVIVGTSAGSVTGTLLRAGIPAEDLAAWCTGAEPSPDGHAFADAFTRAAAAGTWTWLTVPGGVPTVPLRRTAAALRSRTRDAVTAAVSAFVPPGRYDLTPHLAPIDELAGDWPDRPLWLCATRRDDGRRVVFDRHDGVSILDAVHASCAIPGYVRPVRIDGADHVDGAVWSPTNVDLLQACGLDLAVVISPMSWDPSARSVRFDAPLRELHHRLLGTEVEAVRRSGTPVLTIEPTREELSAAGWDPMDDARIGDIVQATFLCVGEMIAAALLDDTTDPSLRHLGSRTPTT
jgi:NTE family protein